MFLNNKFLNSKTDILFHLEIPLTDKIFKQFKNIKYVIFSHSKQYVQNIYKEILKQTNNKQIQSQIKFISERFSIYFINSEIMVIDYGIGMQSLLICLNEISKLLFYANTQNPIYILVNDAIGITKESPLFTLTNKSYDVNFTESFDTIECGKSYSYKIDSNIKLNKALDVKNSLNLTNTLTVNSFYDLSILNTENLKNNFLKKLNEYNIQTISMHDLEFAFFCNQLDINYLNFNVIVSNDIYFQNQFLSKQKLQNVIKEIALICHKLIATT